MHEGVEGERKDGSGASLDGSGRNRNSQEPLVKARASSMQPVFVLLLEAVIRLDLDVFTVVCPWTVANRGRFGGHSCEGIKLCEGFVVWVRRIKYWKNQYLWAWRETERGCQDAEKRETRVRKGERGG